MKRTKLNLCYALVLLINCSLIAQEIPENYLERSPIFDYGDRELTSSATVPDYELKENKLKLTGVVYQEDGETPAANVIILFQQADEDGDFDLRYEDEKRYIHHRAWIKTDNEGRYTYFTFVPGNDRTYNQLQELYPLALDQSNTQYEVPTFLFDEDPLLSKHCRKRMAKKDDISRILKPVMKNGVLTAERNFVLTTELAVVTK